MNMKHQKNKLKKSDNNPNRKVYFREIARDIVLEDRHKRKFGFKVDTGGTIARALEQAYRRGFKDAQLNEDRNLLLQSNGNFVEWLLIPPRPRHAFCSICLGIIGSKDNPEKEGCLVPAETPKTTPGWKLVVSGRDYKRNAISERSIKPLFRLKLLEYTNRSQSCVVISKVGKATWKQFIKMGGQFPDDLTGVGD